MKNKIQNIFIKTLMLVCFGALVSWFVVIVAQIVIYGVANADSSLWTKSGIFSVFPSVINTFLLVIGVLVIAVPIAIFSAMFLWFYENHIPSFVHILQALIDSLGAVPSIVFALFGLILFVGRLQMGFSFLAGLLTMVIVVLPILIRAAEQALQAVPKEVYLSGISLGLSKLHVMLFVLLPQAGQGIFSGIVLAVGRIVGESAALIFTLGTAGGLISSLFSSGRTLAVQVYSLAGEGLYLPYAYATALVLLVFVATLRMISYLILRKNV